MKDLTNPISLAELLNSDCKEPDWVVGGLLPTGGISVIAGKPKTGKSTLLRCMTLAVASGVEFLSRPSLQGPVLYFALEEKVNEVKRHFVDLGAFGDEEAFFYFEAPSAEKFTFLENQIAQKRPRLVVIDPIFRFLEVRDCNDYQETNRALAQLLGIARKSSTHIICSHHMNKGGGSSPDGILGSTAIFGGVDTAIILKRNSTHRTISTVQRYGQDIEEMVLNFDAAKRSFAGVVSSVQLTEQKIEELIVDFLTKNPMIDEAGILKNVSGKTLSVKSQLKSLVDSGKIGRGGEGLKGSPYHYFNPQNASSLLGIPKRELAFQEALI